MLLFDFLFIKYTGRYDYGKRKDRKIILGGLKKWKKVRQFMKKTREVGSEIRVVLKNEDIFQFYKKTKNHYYIKNTKIV